MEQINLKSVITQYPVCLSDDKKLKAILLDLYPNGSKGLIHVLCTIQAAGITLEMQSKGAADELDLCRYRRILQENYGLMGKMVESGLALWQSALIEPKPEPEKKAPAAPRKKKKATESDDLTHIHSYTDTVVPPTCAEQGYTLHSCACGYEYKDNYKPKLPHTYEEIETVPPTCDSDGAQKMHCKNCGAEKIVTLPKREHEFGNWEVTTPATCETEGAEARTCKLCGYIETRTVPAEQHDFSDWIEKTHADCTHSGTETRFCRKCNFTETRKIKALGHAWNRWHPSAEKEKTAERYCSRCGQTEEEAFDYEEAKKQYGDSYVGKPKIWQDYVKAEKERRMCIPCKGCGCMVDPIEYKSCPECGDSIPGNLGKGYPSIKKISNPQKVLAKERMRKFKIVFNTLWISMLELVFAFTPCVCMLIALLNMNSAWVGLFLPGLIIYFISIFFFESVLGRITEKCEAVETVLEWIDKMHIFLTWLFIALIVLLGVGIGCNSCK